MIKEAWKVISAESRAAFAADFKKALRRNFTVDRENHCVLNGVAMGDLCRKTNCVESRWGKMQPAVAVIYLQMAWSKCEKETIEWILRFVIMNTRHDSLEELYRCLEVTQDDVNEQNSKLSIVGSNDRQWSASERLQTEDGMSVDDRLLLFATIANAGIMAWRDGAKHVVKRIIAEFVQVIPAAAAITPPQVTAIDQQIIPKEIADITLGNEPIAKSIAQVESSDSELDEGSPQPTTPVQTPFDHLIINEVIRRVRRDTIADAHHDLITLVDEVAKLDPLRIQTSFHFGFIDAMCERLTSERMAGDNHLRRSWYLAGYLLGIMRAHESQEVARWFTALSASDRDAIVFKDSKSAAPLIAKDLLRCLVKAQDWEAFGRMSNQLSYVSSSIVMNHLHEIQERLQERNYTAARILVKHMSEQFVTTFQTHPKMAPLAVQYDLMLGDIERGEGRFQQAGVHYQNAITRNTNPESQNEIPTGLIFCELGIPNMESMVITSSHQHQWAAVLSNRQAAIKVAISDDSASSDFKFLGAIHDLLGCTPKIFVASGLGREILGTIEKIAMLDDQSPQAVEAVARFQAYAALADLQGAVEVKADAAARVFAAWLKDVRKEHLPPIELTQQALVAAILYGPDSAHELAQAFIHCYGAKAVREFPISDVCEKSIPVARLVLDQIMPDGRGLDTKERFGTAKQLLIAMLDSEQTDTSEIGNEVFDLMQQIVRDDSTLQKIFLQFVEESDQRLQKIMDLETRQHAVLSVAEAGTDSQFLAATAIRLMAGAQSDKAFLQDLLEIVEQCNLENTIPAHLRHCLNEADRVVQPHNAGQLDGAGLCIAFVGGDERQSQYESDIAESLKNKFPELEFWFHYPGWTSNWNRHLSEIDNKIQAHRPSVLVLSPYVRTQFGRNIRAKMSAMNIQWRACTGRGRSSIQRAMEAAVDVAAGIGVRQ